MCVVSLSLGVTRLGGASALSEKPVKSATGAGLNAHGTLLESRLLVCDLTGAPDDSWLSRSEHFCAVSLGRQRFWGLLKDA